MLNRLLPVQPSGVAMMMAGSRSSYATVAAFRRLVTLYHNPNCSKCKNTLDLLTNEYVVACSSDIGRESGQV